MNDYNSLNNWGINPAYKFDVGNNAGGVNTSIGGPIGSQAQGYGLSAYGQPQIPNTGNSSVNQGFGFNQESMFGDNGWITGGAQVAGSLLGAWNGYQQTKIAKDQLNFQRNYANRNLANQAADYNARLEDRARVRNSFNDSDVNVADYVEKNKVDGSAI